MELTFIPDVQRVVASLLDNSELKKLYLCNLLTSLPDICMDEHFWHSRVETLTQTRVEYQSSVNWKQTYHILSIELYKTGNRMEKRGSTIFWLSNLPSFHNLEDNTIVLKILYSLHFRPAYEALVLAAKNNSINIFRYLLEEGSLSSVSNLTGALITASREGHEEIVKLLLTDTTEEVNRADPGMMIEATNALLEACTTYRGNESGNYTRIVELILKHGSRTNPNWRHSAALDRCSNMADNWEIVKLLIADKRFNPTELDNNALICAASRGRGKIVEVLLADRRVNPSAQHNKALLWAVRGLHLEVVKLLLSHRRINIETHELENLLDIAQKMGRRYGRQDIATLIMEYL